MSIQVTNKDLVLLGHGSYGGGTTNTTLPVEIDLYILQPVGYTLMTDVASALIQQREIRQIRLRHDGRGNDFIDPPIAKYLGGTLAPNFTLYNLGSLSEWGKTIIGNKKNVVTVDRDTLLSELIKSDPKINEALKQLPKGEKLKLYWSACANQVSGYTASL
ncbi:MAG: hypothetical protein V4572_06885 [Bacteroidota bacterium]